MRARTILRWGGRIAVGAIALVLIVAALAYGLSEFRMGRTYAVPDHPITPRTDSASLALGARLAKVRGCADCHGANLGGSIMAEDPALGRLVAPNLTMGGRGAQLDARDWERAVRHGVRRDGTPLRVMPAQELATMADDELEAIVGYIKSVPPVSATQPSLALGPLIRVLFVAGQVKLLAAEQIDHGKAHMAHVEPAPTAKYGEYLAIGCTGCHGPGLSGGKIPGGPPDWKPAANITPTGIGRYSQNDFIRVMRTGTRPDGSQADSLMPYRLTKEMTDVELQAIYAYLQTVPPKAYGNR
jgi:mono/diheme cytochrome c family protein